ncbi:MAG TPA: DUF1549 domain-containing protein, partial [Acetobacteraceae bacterium]|nr:DUF1549 domain-containing protein [Acetobacteraceae bacterium]
CHGAAAGKNGFGLSLFGFDPARDLRTLTRDLRGRRLDPAEPEQSLMLQKATNAVAHKGGLRVKPDSDHYGELRAWIAAGAPADLGKAPLLQGIELLPGDAVLAGRGLRLPFLLRARYADGSDRDVTALALWSSSNEAACTIDKQGLVTSGDPGESCVLARFGPCAQAIKVLVLPADQAFTWTEVPEANFVDQLVHAKLRRAHVLPAGTCSDEVFVRRLHLDLLNVLPTPAAARAFCADTDPDKRSKLIDALLLRPEFAAAMAMTWAEVLQVDAQTMEAKGASLLYRWLQDAFAQGRPFDDVVREMLTAEGSSFGVPPANFLLAAQQPNLLAEKVAQNFLGIRLQCAQCHNHPFENWTMDDYYGFAAFFAQLGRKRGEDPYESLLWNRGNGEVAHKRDGSVVAPRFLGGGPAPVPAGSDRRQVLAQWLCSPDNPYFARNVVNRLWARLFGRGIVDPPDDVRVSNPPSHPQLLQQLALLLVEHQFDVRVLFRVICNSRTWQLGPHADAPAVLFAGNLVRRLSAEQLLDAIGAVTGV